MKEPRDVRDAPHRPDTGLDPVPGSLPVAAETPVLEPVESLTVVQERWSGEGITLFAAALITTSAATFIGLQAFGLLRTPGAVWGAAGLFGIGAAAAARVLRRRLLRQRQALTVDAEGIALWQSHPIVPEHEWTRIPWTDIVIYHTSVRPGEVRMMVVSRERRFIDYREAPASPEAVELARRLAEQAERHPRAPEAPREALEPRGDPVFGVRTLGYAAVGGALVWAGVAAQGRLRVPPALQLPMLLGAVALVAGVRLWLHLDDSDLAHADRNSRTWKARLRTRLRALLAMRHV